MGPTDPPVDRSGDEEYARAAFWPGCDHQMPLLLAITSSCHIPHAFLMHTALFHSSEVYSCSVPMGEVGSKDARAHWIQHFFVRGWIITLL